jgi:hypothetical protein
MLAVIKGNQWVDTDNEFCTMFNREIEAGISPQAAIYVFSFSNPHGSVHHWER